MIRVSITPEDSVLADLVGGMEMMSTKYMPKTFKAFKMSTKIIEYTWKSYALGAPIPGGAGRLKMPTGAYARSIKTRMISPFNYEIISDSPHASALEDGTKQYDMKETHPYGKRSRVVKKTVRRKGVVIRRAGDPYLIIPFRRGIPGAKTYKTLPAQLYMQIRQAIRKGDIQLSQVTKGKKRSPNYRGELIPRAKFQWGTRIVGVGIENLEGMVALDVSTPKSKRTTYMTFRVISVNSPTHKWIQKARPGLHLAKNAAINTQGIVKEMIASGLRQDLGVL